MSKPIYNLDELLGQSDQSYAQSLLNARRNRLPSNLRDGGAGQALETPMFSPDDLIGTGLITKAALMAKGLLPLVGVGMVKSVGKKNALMDIAKGAAPKTNSGKTFYRGSTADETSLRESVGDDMHWVRGVSTADNPEYAKMHGDNLKQYTAKDGEFIDFFDLLEQYRMKFGDDAADEVGGDELAKFGESQGFIGSTFHDPQAGTDYRFFSASSLNNAPVAQPPLPKTQYELAHDEARIDAWKNHGLPENNTAMDRANALGKQVDVYHGTKQDVTGGFQPVYGDGLTFTTPEPKFASDWIGKGARQQRTGDIAEQERKQAYEEYKAIREKYMNHEQLDTLKGDEFNKEWDLRSAQARAELERNGLSRMDDGIHGNVLPLKARVENTFIPSRDHAQMADYIKSTFPDGVNDQGFLDMFKNGDYIVYETPKAVEHLKGLGYDSMMLRESASTPDSTLAVFDPSKLRSRFAAFNMSKKGSSDLLAGGAAGAFGLNALSGLYQDDMQ